MYGDFERNTIFFEFFLLCSGINNEVQKDTAESSRNSFGLFRYAGKGGNENKRLSPRKFAYLSGKICLGMEENLHTGENLFTYGRKFTCIREEIYLHTYPYIRTIDKKHNL
jgi:hypothetical protein